jgi:hypothetical protein
MRLLTEDAVLVCKHEMGRIKLDPSQNVVTIAGRRVLVEKDPEGRPIKGCPNIGATIKPCTRTLAVKVGYSGLLRVGGRRVCLDTVGGLTDGTPPGVVQYHVQKGKDGPKAGQDFVMEAP